MTASEAPMAFAMTEGPTHLGRSVSTVPTAQTVDLVSLRHLRCRRRRRCLPSLQGLFATMTAPEPPMPIAKMVGPAPFRRAASTVLTAQTADLVSLCRRRLPSLQGLFAPMTASEPPMPFAKM
eukprot:2368764-Pleurochrysis_carterae.AAC.1